MMYLRTCILKLLEEDGLTLLTGLINNIFETGEWPRDFFGTMIAINKKPQATKCIDHRNNEPHQTYSKASSEDT